MYAFPVLIFYLNKIYKREREREKKFIFTSFIIKYLQRILMNINHFCYEIERIKTIKILFLFFFFFHFSFLTQLLLLVNYVQSEGKKNSNDL